MNNGFNFTNVLILLVGVLFIIAGYQNKTMKEILSAILSGDIEGVFAKKETLAAPATAGSSGASGLDGGGGFGGGGGGSW